MKTTPMRNTPLRFAVLEHTNYPGHQDHYDVVLEMTPGNDPEQVSLIKFESTTSLHNQELRVKYSGNVRRRYLQFEGPMSEGRGHVRRVDEGTYRFTGSDVLDLNGQILNGRYFCDTGSPCEILRTIKKTELLLKDSESSEPRN